MDRCRIWWPRQQHQSELESVSARYLLFGWLFPHAGSVDIVVAAFVSEGEILRSFPNLDTFQTAILSSNKRMPTVLQESAAFTILGDCVVHLPRDFEGCCVKQKYDCSVLDGFLDTCKKSVVKRGDWVHFCCKPEKSLKCNLNQIPVLHHLYLDDQKVEINHCHVCHTL